MKKRMISIILLVLLILNLNIPIYADDELEEIDISQGEIDEIIETAVDLSKIPNINSRNAVVYDRTSRSNTIWKTGK